MAGRPWILCRDTGHGRELLADPGPWCELCLTPAPAGRALHLCQLSAHYQSSLVQGKALSVCVVLWAALLLLPQKTAPEPGWAGQREKSSPSVSASTPAPPAVRFPRMLLLLGVNYGPCSSCSVILLTFQASPA